jgi:serine protease Do
MRKMFQSSLPAVCAFAAILFSSHGFAAPRSAAKPPPAPISAAEMTQAIKKVQQSVLPSVVRLQVLNKDGSPGLHFTGLVVGDGLVATNLLCAAGSHAMTATYKNGRAASVAGMAAFDEKHTLALLRVPTLGITPVPLEETVSVKPGDPAFAIGDPNAVIVAATFRRMHKDSGSQVLEIAGDVSPYSFGASFIDKNGRVIGLMSTPSPTESFVTLAYPAFYLRRLLAHLLPQTLTWQESEKQFDRAVQQNHPSAGH